MGTQLGFFYGPVRTPNISKISYSFPHTSQIILRNVSPHTHRVTTVANRPDLEAFIKVVTI